MCPKSLCFTRVLSSDLPRENVPAAQILSKESLCRSWWDSQSLSHVFLPVSIPSYLWNQMPGGRKEPCSAWDGGQELFIPSADSSLTCPAGTSTSMQSSARHLIQISPYHQYLSFPSACFRKLSPHGGNALDVSSTLSRAELPNWVLSYAGEARDFGACTSTVRTWAVWKRTFFTCRCLEEIQGLDMNSVT